MPILCDFPEGLYVNDALILGIFLFPRTQKYSSLLSPAAVVGPQETFNLRGDSCALTVNISAEEFKSIYVIYIT